MRNPRSKKKGNPKTKAKKRSGHFSFVDEDSLFKIGNNINYLANNINSLPKKIGQYVDETKKLKDNCSSLINEMKSSNEKTLNEIKTLNENQVRLLNILAGNESPEKKR